ncbi:MAG: DUF4097 family beta strand repeat-containing protein [Actinomycetota bacterium]
MPTYDTPQPITVVLELGVADVRIHASDRTDTVVDVQPGDPTKKADVTAAGQTRVEYANGTLLITAPKVWRQWTPWGGHESIDVRIDVPAGSTVRGTAGVASLRATGGLGECAYRAGVGDVVLERADRVEIKSGAGDVAVDAIEGRADVKTAGSIRIGTIAGPAVIKNTNGDTSLGEVTGDARVHASNGSIAIDLARSSIAAKTANGDVRIEEVRSGSVEAQSALGTVEIGIPNGVSAWLDLETKFGHVRNDLEDADRAEPGADVVEVHAHTSMGDVTIRRALAAGAGRRQP